MAQSKVGYLEVNHFYTSLSIREMRSQKRTLIYCNTTAFFAGIFIDFRTQLVQLSAHYLVLSNGERNEGSNIATGYLIDVKIISLYHYFN